MRQKFAAYDAQRIITGFYDSIDSPVPDGMQAVAITDEQHALLLAGQSDGKRMTLDDRGVPCLLDPLPRTRAQLADAKRTTRDIALHATDWLVARHQDEKLIGDGTTLTADQLVALLKYRQALRDLSGAAGWPNIDLPAVPDFVPTGA
ncbi:hypothetical protein R69746_06961 [Paraburkholderia aspalathi]|uniref:phage tail assembly chaperone n=1 Tax=Paraburkholderia aspalathi TaxID=1324617 RepID=UPI00190DCA1F|nr:phage tail assembly chaperone [Paraburkholderia aspalathi]MBK3842953.1 phage tail protein [Paraburkholderia aspalathi]CAE6841846.1 hypothetical protein R69746_06961 [Paraburkholderia aspalathi]